MIVRREPKTMTAAWCFLLELAFSGSLAAPRAVGGWKTCLHVEFPGDSALHSISSDNSTHVRPLFETTCTVTTLSLTFANCFQVCAVSNWRLCTLRLSQETTPLKFMSKRCIVLDELLSPPPLLPFNPGIWPTRPQRTTRSAKQAGFQIGTFLRAKLLLLSIPQMMCHYSDGQEQDYLGCWISKAKGFALFRIRSQIWSELSNNLGM